jgi:hypothetical protein
VGTPKVSNGPTLGWNVTATSTTWSTAGGKTLPTTATTTTSAPTAGCDASFDCIVAVNAVGYTSWTLPAAVSAPLALKLFNAAANTGIGHQTITPTLSLSVPASAYSGLYTTTITVTLVSAP